MIKMKTYISMKKIIKTKLKEVVGLGLTIALITFGCVDLDENPIDFPAPDNFYQTESQIVSGLAGAMDPLYQQWGNYSYGWGSFHDDANGN